MKKMKLFRRISLFVMVSLLLSSAPSEAQVDPAGSNANVPAQAQSNEARQVKAMMDIEARASPTDHLAQQRGNPRHARVQFSHYLTNEGPGPFTFIDFYVAIPPERSNQIVSDLTMSPEPAGYFVDQYDQEVAYFHFADVAPGSRITVTLGVTAEIVDVRHEIDPDKVGDLSQVPDDIASLYTSNESKYKLESPVLQGAAVEAIAAATNPYTVTLNIHDFVAERLYYYKDGRWDDAETVYLQGHGSCTEYTWLFIALCRLNGIPARYVGSTLYRGDGYHKDEIFHRWAEVYVPGYDWIPVDVTLDDLLRSHTYFGAHDKDHLVTTVGGGNSTHLGWQYHSRRRWDYPGERPSAPWDRYFEWFPFPPSLRVTPSSLAAIAEIGMTSIEVGSINVNSTNGDFPWSASSSVDWLHITPESGTTPDTIQVSADVSGLAPGEHQGQVIVESDIADSPQLVSVCLTIKKAYSMVYLAIVLKNYVPGAPVGASRGLPFISFD